MSTKSAQKTATKPVTCVFDQASRRCIEHGKSYTGERECAGAHRGELLEKAIAFLQARRDKMRLVWTRD